jgi:SAM-dependent methyltransferase
VNRLSLPGRHNLLERDQEIWKSPVFESSIGRGRRLKAALRRCLDLQAASIWSDLSVLLKASRGKVIDVGCGAQPYRALLPDDAQYVGLDTVDARDHFDYEEPSTVYFAGDTWPVESGSADLVLATEVLEHVPRPAQFLAEARRCLKAQGNLILTVPFAARWHYIPHDYWRFTPSGLRLLFEEAGFGDIVIHARGNEWTVACYKCMAILLSLLLGRTSGPVSLLGRLLGAALSPMLIVLAAIGHLSLRSPGGDDCLGYTITAVLHQPCPSEHA